MNVILTVTGTEKEKNKDNSIEVEIKNDMGNFNDEEIKKLEKKMKNFIKLEMMMKL